jgi:hypothetical protein
MCPLCASTLAWLAFGAGSAGGLGAFLACRRKGKDYGDDFDDASRREP